jgi:hypothetical protein
MERSLAPLSLAVAIHYSRREFLNTPETTEFSLDFSTGDSRTENATNGNQSGLEFWTFQ